MSGVRLPPGPRSKLLCTYRVVVDPITAFREWRARYGPVFSYPSLSGTTVAVADPELVRQVFANADLEAFDVNIPDPFDVLIGRRSLLFLSGATHQRERKLLAPPFRGERMRGWAGTIADATRRAFTTTGEARQIVALERMQEITLDVIVRVVFGFEDEHAVDFFEAIREMVDASRLSFVLVRQTQRDLFGLLPYKRYRLASERVDALCMAHIERVRAQLRERPGSRDDILAMMIEARYDDGSAMSNLAIRDELRTLLLAGHETTATMLAWAIYFIHRDPEVLARVREAIDDIDPDAPDRYARVPYLEAVFDETTRMRPISAQFFRQLRKEYQLGEWRLPPGITLSPAVELIHHDPELWPEPHTFRPERFLERRPAPHEFMPFGGGTRRCLGASFARYEAAIVLATLVRELDFELLDRDVAYGPLKLTLGPLGGVRMRFNRRAHADVPRVSAPTASSASARCTGSPYSTSKTG